MTFYALLIITPSVMKIVKNLKKIVSVSRFDPDPAKKVVYFFATFLYAGIKVFVDFFLNRESVNFLIILLNIILKINE